MEDLATINYNGITKAVHHSWLHVQCYNGFVSYDLLLSVQTNIISFVEISSVGYPLFSCRFPFYLMFHRSHHLEVLVMTRIPYHPFFHQLTVHVWKTIGTFQNNTLNYEQLLYYKEQAIQAFVVCISYLYMIGIFWI